MIRVKFVYDEKQYWDLMAERRIVMYDKESFYWLVQGDTATEKKEPPFRDDDSVRFIREVDHAEFVEGDWYSIVTPYNRTDMTALCGGTRYALTVIDNSRYGRYTSYDGYGKDIWSRLADLSLDVLIYIKTSELSALWPCLGFAREIEEKVVIENYRYQGEEREAYLHKDYQRGTYIQDGRLYVKNEFQEFLFRLDRDFALLIEEAEYLLKRAGRMYRCPPLVMSVEEFAETLDDQCKDYLCSYLDGRDSWADDYDEMNRFLKNLTVHNYLHYIPEDTLSKYPIYFVMKKNRHTGECTITKEYGWKWPHIACILAEEFVRLSEDEKQDFIKMTVVIDSELFWHGAKEFEHALWAFKLYDNTAELYDRPVIYREFLDFIKQPFEDGLVKMA